MSLFTQNYGIAIRWTIYRSVIITSNHKFESLVTHYKSGYRSRGSRVYRATILYKQEYGDKSKDWQNPGEDTGSGWTTVCLGQLGRDRGQTKMHSNNSNSRIWEALTTISSERIRNNRKVQKFTLTNLLSLYDRSATYQHYQGAKVEEGVELL